MRKLSIKGKRGKSEVSDNSDMESENNGDASGGRRDLDESSNDDKQGTSEEQGPSKRSNALIRKRSSRLRGKHNENSDNEEDSADVSDEKNGELEGEEKNGKPSSSKKRKKTERRKVEKEEKKDDEEYEVEKVIDQRTIKGRRQFLIRWKGYDSDADTWEQEKDLNCPKLIEDFLAEKEEDEQEEEEEEKPSSKTSPKKKSKGKGSKKNKKEAKKDGKLKMDEEKTKEEDDEENDEETSKEYEVDRIIDVRIKKNKSREFLIRWKGFTSKDDTWEPEEHLSCPDLIEKFLEKLEKVKNSDIRELRANPEHTKRYVTHNIGKRHSRRHSDRQRVTYHHCED